MKIGIIGAGQIGGTLVRQYSKAGHHVKVANSSGIEKLRSLALETGASAVTLMDVIIDVEVVVISIPLIGILKLPKRLFKDASASITIIDTSNYWRIGLFLSKRFEKPACRTSSRHARSYQNQRTEVPGYF